MLWKGRRSTDIVEKREEHLDMKKTVRLAAVTSIDAFLLGIAFGILDVPVKGIFLPFIIVSIVAVWLGVYVGHWFGFEHKSNAYNLSATILLLSGVNLAVKFWA